MSGLFNSLTVDCVSSAAASLVAEPWETNSAGNDADGRELACSDCGNVSERGGLLKCAVSLTEFSALCHFVYVCTKKQPGSDG